MQTSLVPCPKCGTRRHLVSIQQVQGEDVRRFRCDKCEAEADYIVSRGRAEPRRSARLQTQMA